MYAIRSYYGDAYVIVPDSEQPELPTEKADWKSQEPAELLAQIKDMGIA